MRLNLGILVLLATAAPGVGTAAGQAQTSPGSKRAPATAMGTLAASMAPGTWAELKTEGIVEALKAKGASGCTLGGFHEDGAWDPVTLQFFALSGDHNDALRFVVFSANTNAWSTLPTPPWYRGGTVHGYDHHAINPATGELFYRPFGSKNVHKYSIAKQAWSEIPAIGISEYLGCCNGLEYFPEMGGLFLFNGAGKSAHLWKEGSAQWTTLTRELADGGIHGFAEYGPAHKTMIFGGGNAGPRKLYKCDASGKVTPLKDAPVHLENNGRSVVTVDPVSGDFLVLGGNQEFYVYDVLGDAWKAQPGKAPVFTPLPVPQKTAWHIVATPVSSYGVTMFVKYHAGTPQGWVYLYKHSNAAKRR